MVGLLYCGGETTRTGTLPTRQHRQQQRSHQQRSASACCILNCLYALSPASTLLSLESHMQAGKRGQKIWLAPPTLSTSQAGDSAKTSAALTNSPARRGMLDRGL